MSIHFTLSGLTIPAHLAVIYTEYFKQIRTGNLLNLKMDIKSLSPYSNLWYSNGVVLYPAMIRDIEKSLGKLTFKDIIKFWWPKIKEKIQNWRPYERILKAFSNRVKRFIFYIRNRMGARFGV